MPDAPRILLSSGEASGDLYASELLRALRERVPAAQAFGMGGDWSLSAGTELLVHLDEISVIGLVEVVRKLPALRRAKNRLLQEARRRRPHAAVLVDFSGFHLRLARGLKALGIPILYYVSPQVWAWRRGRVRAIRERVDEMLVILPFEESFYRGEGIHVRYVGHPLVDLVRSERDRRSFCRELGLEPARPILLMLPGSRRREIQLHVPVLRSVIEALCARRPDVQIVVSRAPTISAGVLESALGSAASRVRILSGGIYDGLAHAAAAVVASGTATVEAALSETPMVVVYKVGRASYSLGKPFVQVPHYSMVNLIAGRSVVPELIQDDMTEQSVLRHVLALLDGGAEAAAMREGLREVKARLGSGGASSRAAEAVIAFLDRVGSADRQRRLS